MPKGYLKVARKCAVPECEVEVLCSGYDCCHDHRISRRNCDVIGCDVILLGKAYRFCVAHKGDLKSPRRSDTPEMAAKRQAPKVKVKLDRTHDLKYKYRITAQQWEDMLLSQNGLCGICILLPDFIGKTGQRFQLDHCHKTDKVRGLLCRHCNRGLGLFQDSVEILRNARDYLSRPPLDIPRVQPKRSKT